MASNPTLVVPQTITEAQADMLGMPKEYYESAVKKASAWVSQPGASKGLDGSDLPKDSY